MDSSDLDGGIKKIQIEDILGQISANKDISDIHMAAWEYICFRISWEVVKYTKLPKFTQENMEIIIKQLMKSNQKAFESFLADKEADLSFISNDGTPYRVNVFFKLGKMWVVLRKINSEALPLDMLFFDDIANSIKKNVLWQKSWLFLVTWPTWSWKSTTLVAMIDYLNKNRTEHIITIEDPVEFVFKWENCIVSQREVWHDTWAFKNALRAAMREDPDIILVWEIRDKETAEAVLNLAETWHLVFSTLHTSSASWTINRYISFFPPEIQDSIADRLWDATCGVVSQRLVKKSWWKWRCWIYELMLNTSGVRNNIKKRQLSQIDSMIETWVKQWMISVEQYARKLIDEGMVSEETLSWVFNKTWK